MEVRTANLSEATLIDAQHSAVSIVDKLGIDKDSSIDIRNNRVELNVVDKAALDAKLDLRGQSLPRGVTVVKVDSLSNPTADIFGGKALTTCTSGFSVTDGTLEGVTTAGHCQNAQSYRGTSLTYQGGTLDNSTGRHDIQWHSTTSFTVRNLVYDGSLNRYIYDEALRSDRYVGQNVCMYGKVSGGDCGEILSTTFDIVNVETDIVVTEGDSGGPFFWNNTAFGTTISVIEEADSETRIGSVYGPVDQIKNVLDVDLIFD